MQVQIKLPQNVFAPASNDEVTAQTSADPGARSAIEQLAPHLIPRITAAWGTWRLHSFLSRVTMMDRPEREGFPPEVAMELFTLFLLNKELAGIPDFRDISR
ncbi:MAG: hypothetical protein HY255_12270 [Betaproteobacteria bacterium]|nr:hypothetical protein [Betaproteobacteria bacterium]